jgi:hypothetical protein
LPNKLVHFEKNCMAACMEWRDGLAYFAGVLNYRRKMFMKLSTGANVIKLFAAVSGIGASL